MSAGSSCSACTWVVTTHWVQGTSRVTMPEVQVPLRPVLSEKRSDLIGGSCPDHFRVGAALHTDGTAEVLHSSR